MFNELDDDTIDIGGELERSSSRRRASDAVQVRGQLHQPDARLHFAALPLHPDYGQKADAGNISTTTHCRPEQLFTDEQHRYCVSVQRGDEAGRRLQRRPGHLRRLRHGRRDASAPARGSSAAFASSNSTRPSSRRTRLGLFAPQVTAREQQHRPVPERQLGAGAGDKTNLRFSYSTTVNRPEFRELAEFEFTDVVGNRAVKGNPELIRALIQNVDGRWEMFSGGRERPRRSVFYKSFDNPIERVVDRARPTRSPPSRTRITRGISASSSRPGSSSARTSS